MFKSQTRNITVTIEFFLPKTTQNLRNLKKKHLRAKKQPNEAKSLLKSSPLSLSQRKNTMADDSKTNTRFFIGPPSVEKEVTICWLMDDKQAAMSQKLDIDAISGASWSR